MRHPDTNLASYRPFDQQYSQTTFIDTQPVFLGAITNGGADSGMAQVTCDTGAAFTLITRDVVKRFGLRLDPCDGYFMVANGQQERIVGECDLHLQVHDDLELQLGRVKVQAAEGYQFLLGSDVLRGNVGGVTSTSVDTGDKVVWRWGPRGMTVETKLLNPIGPAGDHLVGAAAEQPSTSGQQPARAPTAEEKGKQL